MRRQYTTMRRVAFMAAGTLLILTLVVVLLFPDWLADLRQPFRCHLTDVERELVWITVDTVTSALESANITYFMVSGTLLGSYRYHDLIPWDDDVDLIVPTSERSALAAAVAPLEPDFRLMNETPAGCEWKVYMTAALPGTYRSWRLRASRWPFVDVFFYDRNATNVWNACHWYKNEVWPMRIVFPLRRRPFGHLSLPAPCDSAAALEMAFHDVSRCRSRNFDHRRDRPIWLNLRRPAEVECSSLETLWPFTRRRRWTDNSGVRQVTETLWSAGGQRVLREITLLDHCH